MSTLIGSSGSVRLGASGVRLLLDVDPKPAKIITSDQVLKSDVSDNIGLDATEGQRSVLVSCM